MDAIEAAAMAAAEKAFSDAFHDMNVGDGQPLKAAIAAYLEATGVERDAERYREWKRAFREGECGLWNALCEANSDAEHDAAIDSARGGEHG